MTKKIFCALLAATLFLVLSAGCGGQKTTYGEKTGETTKERVAGDQFGPPAPGPKPGEKAPSFKLLELTKKKEITFPEDFRGKKVALLFFSSG